MCADGDDDKSEESNADGGKDELEAEQMEGRDELEDLDLWW